MYICKDDKNTELMKRILTLTLLALSALAAAAQPDTPVVKYLKGDIRRAAFNTHSYEFEPVKDTPAPKGYKAFYISHYGRHGSRSDWTSWSATSSPRPMSSIS